MNENTNSRSDVYEGWHKLTGGNYDDLHYFSCTAHNGVVKTICGKFVMEDAVSYAVSEYVDDLFACDKCKQIRFEDVEPKE